MLTEQDARTLTTTVLGHVTADDAEVHVYDESLAQLRFAANTFLTSGRAENTTVTVTAWIGGRRAAASTNDLSTGALAQVVRDAETIARVSPVDVEYLPTLGPQTYRPTPGYAEATANVSVTERARRLSEVIAASESAKLISAGFHQAGAVGEARATRHGNFLFTRASLASLSMTARMPDGSSSGYFLRNHFDVARLDTARVAREAVRRAVESRDARPLPAGDYAVILEPQAVADLLASNWVGSLFDARQADEGRSAFSASGGRTRVGDTIFDERLSLVSDPWRAELPGDPATWSGLPAEVVPLVRNGRLEQLVYSRFWAKKKDRPPTPGPVNVILESSAPPTPVEELIRGAKRALLVGRFWYIRNVDPRTATVTGLTRDGMWLVEDGRIAHPVRNFRFNQSLIEMLAPGNVEAIGPPERVGGSEDQGQGAMWLPALRLKTFHLTSQSEAV